MVGMTDENGLRPGGVSGSEISGAKVSRTGPSADILGLKFLPVRSEGSFVILPSLGDLA